LQLTVIGSGTAIPQRDRSAPCYLIRYGRENIVVDLGSGSVRGLLFHAGVTVREIGLVLVTHLHPDHCSDLVPLLFALRADEVARHEPLRIFGPEGLRDHYRILQQLWKHRVEPRNYALYFEEWSGGESLWGSFRIEAAPTDHSVPNLAWRIQGPDGQAIIVTGDGEPTMEMVQMCCSSRHVLVAECSLAAGETMKGHMNPGQAGELARQCRSEKLVLSHLNPGVKAGPAGMQARKQFAGEVLVAEDGMVIEV